MLLQNTLDLSTFEIVRFRIWNQTSNPDDYGVGTKYFNTNSGHEGYNRENIYTATGWRRTAYMDDIEALTNGEGSLGTRVKALEDMLGLEDVTDVIDTWNDVKEFFANVDEGLNLMTMLDRKLDKTGGAMKGTGGYVQEVLSIDTDNEFYTIFSVKNQGILKGRLEWTPDTASGASVAGFGLYNATTRERLHLSDNGGVFFGINPLIHKGNVGDYTAGAAKKLETAVSLWGNEFDGTKSLSGSIRIANDSGVISLVTSGGVIQMVGITSGNKLYFGTDACLVEGVPTLVHGKNIQFIVGDSLSARTSAMTITEDGNVNVGTAFEGFKFSVYGGMTFLHGVESSALTLGQMPTNGLLVGNINYGIGQWFQGGQGHIQASSFGNTTATAYALNLNPLGGAVNIASVNANTNVLGTMVVHGNVGIGITDPQYRLDVLGDLCVNRGNHGPNNTTFRINCADNLVNLYAEDLDDAVCNLCFYVEGGEVMRINSVGNVLLGAQSDNRSGAKLQVAGGATFSNRVLIGGAADDGKSALQVAGLAAFNGGALIPTGQTLTIGSVTFRETAEGEVEVDGNLHATGTLASGGKGVVGENTTGNAMVYQYDLASGESVYTVDNVKGSTNVIVQIFEWNSNTSSWDMILTDVSVKADAITVTFGRTTTVNHMVTVC